MDYRLMITGKAEADLTEIIDYIANESGNPDAAGHLLDEIEKKYDLIAQNPFLYPECSQKILKARYYRKAVTDGNLLIYRASEETGTVYIERFFSNLEDYASKL